MLRLSLLRHSMTEGNQKKRYIGTTDEPLCQEGVALLQGRRYPKAEAVFVSPLCRCVQTAGILYPHSPRYVVEELAECDFGEFENKNYQELSENPRYQAWVDSGGVLPFPGGESREEFQRRSIQGFQKVMATCIDRRLHAAALVAHGGTIMNIMEAFAGQKRSFYQWHVENACGYLVEIDVDNWRVGREKICVRSTLPL